MNDIEQERLKTLLRASLAPTQGDLEPRHDLWPDMQRRIAESTAAAPWYDWVLSGGLAVFVFAFPAAIPMFLYYL